MSTSNSTQNTTAKTPMVTKSGNLISEFNFKILYQNRLVSYLHLTGYIANTSVTNLIAYIKGRLKSYFKNTVLIYKGHSWTFGVLKVFLKATHRTVRSLRNTTYDMILQINKT